MDWLGDTCLFCGEAEWPYLHRTDHWIIAENQFPYDGTSYHLLLVPIEHVADVLDLSKTSQGDFWNALRWARDHFNLSAYNLGIRCGDCRMTGGTISHVHTHVVVPDRDVFFKMSSKK
jgi:diadenosine tetraphosphate (Ap4A) HIT family hydrolase